MTERIEDEDIRNAPIKWKVPGAGFGWPGGFVALIDKEDDPMPCPFDGPEGDWDVHSRTCRETWVTAWVLEGDTLEEARQSLAESRFRGTAYHLSDCELLDDRPPEDAP